MSCSRHNFLLTCLICLLPVCSFAEKRVIKFFRPVKKGQTYNCNLSSENSRDFTFWTKSGSLKKQDKLHYSVKLTGVMTVLETKYGHPAKINFAVKEFAGTQNEKPVKTSLNGKKLAIELDKPKVLFTVKEYALSKDEKKLLSLLFRPAAKQNLNDLMGTSEKIRKGDSWNVPAKVIINAFAQRGVKISEKQVAGQIVFKTSGVSDSIPYNEFVEEFSIKGIPNFAFQFKALVWLPDDDSTGPIKIERYAKETAEKDISNLNVMTKELSVKGEIIESFNASIKPIHLEIE